MNTKIGKNHKTIKISNQKIPISQQSTIGEMGINIKSKYYKLPSWILWKQIRITL